MKYWIITGCSKGLGRALAELLCTSPNHAVIGINRSQALLEKSNFHEVMLDLQHPEQIVKTLTESVQPLLVNPTELYLILNAGDIRPIVSVSDMPDDEVMRHIQVNVTSSLVMTTTFTRIAKRFDNIKTGVIQVSSGAAVKPIAGWALYCSSKAAVKMFMDVAAQENPGMMMASYDPGIIDTDMQRTIRDSSEAQFLLRSRFIEYQEQGALQNPTEAAQKLIDKFFTES